MDDPRIVAPVARGLGVSDIARSAEFFRDVLGFEVCDAGRTTEVISGAARIWLETPLQAAVLFLQTNNAAGLRSRIAARGGKPGELAEVNWIQMLVFEIRDPDGHALWFGESRGGPDTPLESRLLQKIMPELPVDDVPTAVTYYRDVLGFRVNYQQHDLGVMDRGAVRLLLIGRTPRHTGIGSAYVYVDDADALFAELRGRGAHTQGSPVSQPWGLREFRLLDPDGNRITFGQPFE